MANVIKCNDADVAMRVSDSFALIHMLNRHAKPPVSTHAGMCITFFLLEG